MLSFVSRWFWVLLDLVIPPKPSERLSGRTITVGERNDIRLKHRELVLTFDDGPAASLTEDIVTALDGAGVKATFLMVGTQASANPDLAKAVAEKGHNAGSHTQTHRDLSSADFQTAKAEIDAGRQSVGAAIAPYQQSPFFRFPYMSSTSALDADLARRKIIALDADINGGDDKDMSPQDLRKQALKRVRLRGSGIVLLHDIHTRTAEMLPGFLADLKAHGYTVVHLTPRAS
jgi:peptidoglycan/xylan/chitin deacetylase (PgdA/CDA1 family)